MTPKPPLEFWVWPTGTTNIETSEECIPENERNRWVHVVEHSALTAALNEVASLKHCYDDLHAYMEKQSAEIERLQKIEKDESRKMLLRDQSRLCKENYDIRRAYGEQSAILKIMAEALEKAMVAIASGYSPHQDAGAEKYNAARTAVKDALEKLNAWRGEK